MGEKIIMEIKLQKIVELKGKMILESNLHIGSGNLEMHIGGTDNPIIKHPHTQEPYIPGSSIKGKIRSLLELSTGVAAIALKNGSEGGIANLQTLMKLNDEEMKKAVSSILKIFGCSNTSKAANSSEAQIANDIGPTRASFADCYLNEVWKNKAIDNM